MKNCLFCNKDIYVIDNYCVDCGVLYLEYKIIFTLPPYYVYYAIINNTLYVTKRTVPYTVYLKQTGLPKSIKTLERIIKWFPLK